VAQHRLTSITIGVPNVEETAEFYRSFGLEERSPGCLATRDGGEQLHLDHAPYRQLRRLGIGVDDADDLDRVERSLRQLPEAPAVERSTHAVSVVEPRTGVVVTVSIAERYREPSVERAETNVPGDARRLNQPAAAVHRDDRVRPSKLSHVVLVTPDWEATKRFFVDGVGMHVSDDVAGLMTFLRCSEMHHNLLVQQGPGTLLHHTAWEVDDVDDVGRGAARLLEEDAGRHVWGLGRHAIGSNYFWYLRDPAGNFAEYASDFDRITDDDLYRPKQWSGHEFLYSWSPPPPRAFLEPDDAAEIFATQT
jgi:catechol 2,3-dioxygenase-like lactoylglutathione lyase family enzyme